LPEVVGESGVYFDPTDVSAMSKAITSLLDSPSHRDHLASLALSRARLFTWELAARSLLDCFEEVGPGQFSNSLGRTA
jgi:glycosyltransferase involved in cell wall biosynthesis